MPIDIKLPLEEMVSKSAIDATSLPNSILNRQQVLRFIDLVIDYSVLLKRIRVEKVNAPKGERAKLDLGNIVTEGASTTSIATTRTPTEAVVSYDLVKYRSAFDLRTDFLEDSIEKAQARDTILNMFTKRIAIDSELAAIQSDNSLTVGDGQTDSNNLLGVNDGFTQTLVDNVPSAQQIDAAGAAPSTALYYAMKRAVPARFRVAKPDYVWIAPSGPADKHLLDWSTRATGGGDVAYETGLRPGPWGIKMLEVPLMPEDLSYGTSGTDGSQIWLSPLKNFVYFIGRAVTIEWSREPRQDMWQSTIHYRVDFEIEDPNMVVIAKNVAMSGSDYS